MLQTQTIPSQQDIYAMLLDARPCVGIYALLTVPITAEHCHCFSNFFAITSIKWKKHGESTQLSGAEKGIRKYTTAFFAAATGPGFDDQAPLFYVQLRKKIVLHNKCKQKRP